MNNDPWKFIVKYASIMPLNLSRLRAMFEVEFLLFGETNIGSMNLDCAQIRRDILLASDLRGFESARCPIIKEHV